MYSAYITTINEIRKHCNADRLQCATIFGNNVIVDMSYQKGDKVVYFPVDGQLSADFAEENNLVRKKDESGNNIGGYLEPDKRNIKAIKLRGEQSDGLILPINVLSKYTDISILEDGDRITILNGHEICRKYIPNNTSKRKVCVQDKPNKNETNISYPYFVQHIDTAQLAYNQSAFRPGGHVLYNPKITRDICQNDECNRNYEEKEKQDYKKSVWFRRQN